MAWKSSASHVPVLVLVAKLWQPKSILEVGAGQLSTSLFLDPAVFNLVDNLVSVESSTEWQQRILSVHGTDPRLTLQSQLPIHGSSGFDLVFIDGPQDQELRLHVIKTLSANAKLLVIHDTEFEPYLDTADRALAYRFTFSKRVPHTTILSTMAFDAIELHLRQEEINNNFNTFEEDWISWHKLFQGKN